MQGGGEGILQQQWIPEVEEDIRRTDDVNKVQLDIRLGHSRTVENVMKMLTDEGPLQGVKVCDAGCGTECLSIPLAKEGAIVSASDISVAMVAEAKKQAKIGANPSYCWRSIMAGQEVLKKGCYRRIGDGRTTKVWNQPWLPDEANPCILSPLPDHDENLLFQDQWCWRGDLRGCYSVKHGYRMLANALDHGGSVSDVWSKIWSMKIPPNIRNFLRRCMQGVLPTMSALHSRGVTLLWTDATHLLDASLPFASWVESVITTGPGALVLRCVANCWGIWRGRNDQIWNSKPWQVSRIQTEINQLIISWQQMMSEAPSVVDQSMPHGETVTVGEGILKVFVDAAVFPNSDHAYYGIVVIDGGGAFVAAKNGFLRCHNDVHLAEAMAIKEALSWAKDRSWLRIKVFSDCQMVCQLFERSTEDLSYTGCIVGDCKVLQRHFEVVSIGFIPRSVNKLAHLVARAAHSQPGPAIWMSSAPFCISHLI